MKRSRLSVIAMIAACGVICACAGSPRATQRRYEFGDPSAEEQQLLWLANRARSDPTGEGAWLIATGDQRIGDAIEAFAVDTALVTTDFAAYPTRPPLAWNIHLAVAAKRHALDQAQAHSQSHRGTDGSRPMERVRATGLQTDFLVENVDGYVHDPVYAHAAFQIDWGGPAPSGVQEWPTPGHRMAIMSAAPNANVANVVGMSWVSAPNPTDDHYGPFVVVQEFGKTDEAFIVGTVWRDANGNNFYDIGEGAEGVEVHPDRGDWYAVTASAGGFQIPLPPRGIQPTITLTGTFSGDVTIFTTLPTTNVLADVRINP